MEYGQDIQDACNRIQFDKDIRKPKKKTIIPNTEFDFGQKIIYKKIIDF